MRKRLLWTFITIIVFLISLSMFFGCSQDKKTTHKPQAKEIINKEIAKVSLALALIKTNNEINKQVECLLAESELFKYKDHNALCNAYKKADEELDSLIRLALVTKKVPEEGFLFYIWKSPNDAGECAESLVLFVNKCEDVVGLFTTLDSCQQVEQLTHSADIGTRICRKWNKELIYTLDQMKK